MADSASPLKPAKPSRLGLGCAIPFGLLFAVIGFAAFWFLTLKPVLRSADSADWPATDCEILSSELDSRRGSKGGVTYRAVIRSRYERDGAQYESDRYDFSDGYTNVGVARMRQAVDAHTPGRRTVCYVDPADPAFAVLERKLPGSVWIGAFVLLFPVFGLIFVFVAVRGAFRARAAATGPRGNAQTPPLHMASHPTVGATAVLPEPEPPASGEVVLKPASGRVATFLFLTAFALLWNGVIGFVMFKEFGDMDSVGDWLALLFFLPFALVGLGMLVLAVHAFSRLFAPAVELRLDLSRLRLGESVPFSWRLTARGVRRLTIRLRAREETTFRQGKNRRTERADLYRAVVFESTDSLGLTEGRAELALPAEAVVPTLHAGSNRIVWELAFGGEIPWRADVDDTFQLGVRGPVQIPSLATSPEPREFVGEGATLWVVDRLAPGETLVFTLQRTSAASDAIAGPLTARLGWVAQGKGEADASIVWLESVSDLAPGADRNFEVKLPESPWSFAGSLVSLAWRLEVLDAKERVLVAAPLSIAPRGAPVRLVSLEPELTPFAARKRERQARR